MESDSGESDSGSLESEVSGSNPSSGEDPSSEEDLGSGDEDIFRFPIPPGCKRTPGMSFEDLIKLRDRVGIKKFNEEISNPGKKSTDDKKTTNFKRKNKNRPQEISSKRKVPFLRQDIKTPKTSKIRDPRFDDLCGSEYNEEIFSKRYHFLEEIKQRERQRLTKDLKKAKNSTQKGEIRYLLTRMKQQTDAKEQRVKKREAEREWKKEEKKKVKQGIKKPYFLKDSEKKKLLEGKRKELLKKSGNFEKVVQRKEKKLRSKETKVMPYERRVYTS